MTNQINQLLSKYRECQNCKHKFILSMSTLICESRHKELTLFCPSCNKTNIAQISREQYYKNNRNVV